MIGLTSFNLYDWTHVFRSPTTKTSGAMLSPDSSTTGSRRQNTELFWGSGYFPMKPATSSGSPWALCWSAAPWTNWPRSNKQLDDEGLRGELQFLQGAEHSDPERGPGTAGSRLYWDDLAEKSDDPITGEDFEGYRIYRSTDPGWNDMTPITDGYGSVTYRKPVAQFDLDNEYQGFRTVPLKGVCF